MSKQTREWRIECRLLTRGPNTRAPDEWFPLRGGESLFLVDALRTIADERIADRIRDNDYAYRVVNVVTGASIYP